MIILVLAVKEPDFACKVGLAGIFFFNRLNPFNAFLFELAADNRFVAQVSVFVIRSKKLSYLLVFECVRYPSSEDIGRAGDAYLFVKTSFYNFLIKLFCNACPQVPVAVTRGPAAVRFIDQVD